MTLHQPRCKVNTLVCDIPAQQSAEQVTAQHNQIRCLSAHWTFQMRQFASLQGSSSQFVPDTKASCVFIQLAATSCPQKSLSQNRKVFCFCFIFDEKGPTVPKAYYVSAAPTQSFQICGIESNSANWRNTHGFTPPTNNAASPPKTSSLFY